MNLFTAYLTHSFFQCINQYQLLVVQKVVVWQHLMLESLDTSSPCQKLDQSRVELFFNNFHHSRNFHHNIVEILLKEICKHLWLCFRLFNQFIGQVWCSVQETVPRAKETHRLVILNQLALVESQYGSQDIQRVQTIQVVNNVSYMLYTSVELKECFECAFLEQLLCQNIVVHHTEQSQHGISGLKLISCYQTLECY